MKPNWRAFYSNHLDATTLDFYLKPRKGQEGKRKERLRAFDFANSVIVNTIIYDEPYPMKLNDIAYLGD